MAASIGCSLFPGGFLFQNRYPRFRGAPNSFFKGCPQGRPSVDSGLGTTTRNDGFTQVTYNGWPLYYFAFDEKPGDANGQASNDVWWVLSAVGTGIMRVADQTPSGGADAGVKPPATGDWAVPRLALLILVGALFLVALGGVFLVRSRLSESLVSKQTIPAQGVHSTHRSARR